MDALRVLERGFERRGLRTIAAEQVGLGTYYLAKRGKKLVGSFEFQAGDLDYRAQLTKVKELAPDALFVPAYVTENANAAKQAKELGLKPEEIRELRLKWLQGELARLKKK